MAINIMVLIKNGGYEVVQIPIGLIGELAKSIKSKGSEYLTLQTKVIEVVGFLVTGKQTGQRVIMLNAEDKGYGTTELPNEVAAE